MTNFYGEKFIASKIPKLIKDQSQKPLVQKIETEIKSKDQHPKKPSQEYNTWMYFQRLDEMLMDPKKQAKIEGLLTSSFVLKVENKTPQEYRQHMLELCKILFLHDQKVLENQGRGAEIKDLSKIGDDKIISTYQQAVLEKQEYQKKTLGSWINYLRANDAHYPTWFRYYVVSSLKNMGTIQTGKYDYSTRSSNTLAPFPDMNAEAIAWVYKSITGSIDVTKMDTPNTNELLNEDYNEVKKNKIDEFTKLLNSKKFAQLYALALKEVKGVFDRQSLVGDWVKFAKGSDHEQLEKVLKGKGTGWCTAAGEAEQQLYEGDFYCYFTKGRENQSTEPRIALLTRNELLVEVRGVLPGQELEPELMDIAKAKYSTLPGSTKYEKKDNDMRRLTLIKQKFDMKKELTKDELKFMYEIESPIESFGYDTDPRIETIIKTRNVKNDLANLLDILPEQVSVNHQEALIEGVKYHRGNLMLTHLSTVKQLALPERVNGYLDLKRLGRVTKLVMPKVVNGFVDLESLASIEILKLPELIGGFLNLNSLCVFQKVQFPKEVNGDLGLRSLIESNFKLTLPRVVRGSVDLSSLIDAEKINMPSLIGVDLDLSRLLTLNGLRLPKKIGGKLTLPRGLKNELERLDIKIPKGTELVFA